jgi:hypothetical protein
LKTEKTILIEQKETKYTCDICRGIKTEEEQALYKTKGVYDRFKYRIHTCEICKKDVCGCCSSGFDTDYLEPDLCSNDRPDYVCKICWAIGEKYIKEIKEIRDKAEVREEELMRKWKEACK